MSCVDELSKTETAAVRRLIYLSIYLSIYLRANWILCIGTSEKVDDNENSVFIHLLAKTYNIYAYIIYALPYILRLS